MLRAVSCLAVLTLGVALHSSGGAIYAEEIYYVGPDGGSWHTPDNWSLGRVPSSGDTVRIFDDLTVRITANVPDVGQQLESLTLGYVRDGTIVQDSGNTTVDVMLIGRQDGSQQYRGAYILNGGAMDVRFFQLGLSTRDNVFTVNRGDFTVTDFRISWSGVFTQNAGTVIGGTLMMGTSFGQAPIYNLDGGTLSVPRIQFGQQNSGYFDFDGGELLLPGDWTFDRLVGIRDSDFRAFGNLATPDNLAFDLVVIDTDVYTKIYAIPEPSMLALLSMGAVGLLAYARRRRRLAA